MALLDDIREKIAQDRFEFSKHATDQTILRGILVQELREAIGSGQVIHPLRTRSGSVDRF